MLFALDTCLPLTNTLLLLFLVVFALLNKHQRWSFGAIPRATGNAITSCADGGLVCEEGAAGFFDDNEVEGCGRMCQGEKFDSDDFKR